MTAGRAPAPHCDGTVPPASLVGALPFAPDAAAEALHRLERDHPGAWDERYGWCDGVNLGAGDAAPGSEGTVARTWYAPARFGLNKGVSALLGAAALGSSVVWDAYAAHPWVARGLDVLGLELAR
ncbi:hypothetical protein FH969_04625 [Miniimonas arenae]|uniref:Glycoamylase-like domain-containing protein n=1 Tax=Miniimonas arenae TaxID=676201 RepID=A0A5C5BD78_9MICO|nr:glucoamylase family protein [Miniimonas arenae]TNU76082.1 hypothetical protein FH969_04625 [Miniimonas arenae]